MWPNNNKIHVEPLDVPTQETRSTAVEPTNDLFHSKVSSMLANHRTLLHQQRESLDKHMHHLKQASRRLKEHLSQQGTPIEVLTPVAENTAWLNAPPSLPILSSPSPPPYTALPHHLLSQADPRPRPRPLPPLPPLAVRSASWRASMRERIRRTTEMVAVEVKHGKDWLDRVASLVDAVEELSSECKAMLALHKMSNEEQMEMDQKAQRIKCEVEKRMEGRKELDMKMQKQDQMKLEVEPAMFLEKEKKKKEKEKEEKLREK
ncbi:unnamed protein product [Lota lota]